MSLYIGKNSNNKAIMHITNTSISESGMKTGILPSTSFHTEIQYLTYETYSPTSVIYVSTYGETLLVLPSNLVSLMRDERRAFFMTAELNGVVEYMDSFGYKNATVGYYATQCRFTNTTSATSLSAVMGLPTSSYIYPLFYGNWTNKTIKVHILNYSKTTFVQRTIPYTYSVLIDNNQLTINGQNLINTRYISHEQINTIDPIVNIRGHNYQLINFNPPGSGIIMQTNPNVEIKSGGKTIFTSLFINPTLSFSQRITGTAAFNTYYTNIYGTVIKPISNAGAGTFKEGDMFTFYFDTYKTGAEAVNATCVYRYTMDSVNYVFLGYIYLTMGNIYNYAYFGVYSAPDGSLHVAMYIYSYGMTVHVGTLNIIIYKFI